MGPDEIEGLLNAEESELYRHIGSSVFARTLGVKPVSDGENSIEFLERHYGRMLTSVDLSVPGQRACVEVVGEYLVDRAQGD